MAERIKGRGIAVCLAPGKESDDFLAGSDEMITIIEGNGILESGRKKRPLKKGDSVYIGKRTRYRMKNDSGSDFVFVRIMADRSGKAE